MRGFTGVSLVQQITSCIREARTLTHPGQLALFSRIWPIVYPINSAGIGQGLVWHKPTCWVFVVTTVAPNMTIPSRKRLVQISKEQEGIFL
ncbi:MAG: hypothetical protein EZS28_045292 [Streblomastix strix]|uniref:Uncharacterized protein n=1 Tax=Streblomastix strix TaxID=222440 RepID=A0A5J4TMR9_9EUKA|nr:MAG: hypothetical protein EZS28_045292 [Streblomastix strix]